MTEILISPTRQGTVNITSGSHSITGNDTDFSAADIGKQIRIRTDNGYKSWTVSAVSSATAITISETADFSQDNCYYNTDFQLLDVSAEVSLPVTYSIIDITDPGRRGGTLSKTLVLPGTGANNIIFNHIFEIDADGTFNPNIKADCLIYQDKIEVFRGSFRLLQVHRTFDTITYECAVLGRVTNIYTAFGDKKLSDLDLSAYNHSYTQAIQAASWSLGSDNGYVYPLIDYGETDASGQTLWQVNQLYPAIYVKTLIDRMFAMAGYSYSSAFFNSAFFKKLIIPFNSGSFKYSETEVASRLFEAGISSGSAGITTNVTDQYLTIPYNNDSTAPYFDPSAQFDTSTHAWTVGKTGHYTLNVVSYLQAAFTNTTGLLTARDFPAWIELLVTRSGSPLPVTPIMQDDISEFMHYNGTNVPFNVTTHSVFENMYLLSGDVVTFRVHVGASIPAFSLHVDVLANSLVYNMVVNENISEGDGVVLSDVVPQNIRLSDFFRSITNMFNLYIDEDPDVPNRLNIEPRNDFYAGGALLDWTDKWDRSQPMNITPMGQLTARNYRFTYRADQDYWNDKYSKKFIQKDHNEIYGEYWLPVENDFLTDTQTIDLIFAPTVMSQYKANALVLPSIRFVDTNHALATDKTNPKSSVIRILYYGGLKTGAWTHRSLATGTAVDTLETQYPYAGHFDDPGAPTLDLNFGLTAELYFTLKDQSITNNNLYNKYYSSHFDEITDKDSKVVEMQLRLNPADINALDFRNEIYIAGQYFRLIEITDYDLVSGRLSLCKFMKAKTGKPFVSGTHPLNGGMGGNIGNQRVPLIDYSGISFTTGILAGLNNSTKDGSVLVTGKGNAITGKNVQVFGGNGNTIDASNVTLINTSGQTISTDGTTWIDGAKYIKAGDMAGQATLGSGTTIINFPGISSSSIVLICYTGDGTLTGTLSVTPATDLFTISSTVSGDTAVVNWYVARV
jgi:hypothetical protein